MFQKNCGGLINFNFKITTAQVNTCFNYWELRPSGKKCQMAVIEED